ncbi:MAG: cytochrome c [Betaproteobacteria bacterium]
MGHAARVVLAAAVAAAGCGAAAAVAAAGGAAATTTAKSVAVVAAPAPARQRELLLLLKNDCGSCHGMRLTGGLGPALTPEALRAKPAESLAVTIVSGRPGTAMPPWRRFLSEAEAQWLVARMVNGDVDVR